MTSPKLLAPAPDGSLIPGEPPTFSVIIAAYEVADVIGEALQSIRNQTIQPDEVIVCDDGSTDDIVNAVRAYRDDITFLRKAHGGEASAKNTAAAAASGDFVVILDADDVFMPTRLEALAAAAAARPDLDILTTDAFLEANGKIVRRCYDAGWTFEVENQRRELLRRNFVFGLAAVRRELLLQSGGFDEDILWTTDWDCWIRLVLAGSQIGCVDEPLALYRVRERSLSAQRDSMLRGKIATLEKTWLDPRVDRGDQDVLEEALAAYRRDLSVMELEARLLESEAGVRRAGLAIALGRGFGPAARARGAATALAPATMRRRGRQREQASWVGAGGVRVGRTIESHRRPLRVVVYTDSPQVGGAERSLANLVEALADEVDVTVLGTDEAVVQTVAATRPQARAIVVPFVRSRLDVRSALAHARVLARVNPDIFHANLISPWSCQAAIYIALLRRGTRVVAVEQLPTSPVVPTSMQRLLKRLASRFLDAHVAVGTQSARDVERIVGLREGSVRTIHNGVPDRLAPRRQTDPARPLVGSVGRLETQKGFDVLLSALRLVPNAELLVIGDGPEGGHLQELARDLGVAERVTWAGWLSDPRVRLAEMDVFVLPSRFEGFPLAVVEAMLAERPVVATTAGSVRDAVIEGETGLLVPPDDPESLAGAINQVLADAGRGAEMGRRGRELALERFTARATAAAFEELYADICR
ncbi:MAG: glycosyltransferase [Gaiellaceae bacterium]